MSKILVNREFTSTDHNPNCNGDKRGLLVTTDGINVRMVVSGMQGSGLNTRMVTLSDATVPMDMWDAHKDLILSGLEK